jgi:integrase
MIASYLKKTSVRGNYSFRRRVPQKLKFLWGLSEVKVAFKTKNHAEALRQAASHNTDFMHHKARLTLLLAGKPLSTEHLKEEAREILISRGIHPQQIPSTKTKADAYFQKQEDYKDLYLDTIPTEHGHNPDGSIWTEYLEDPNNPFTEAYAVLEGKPTRSIAPNLKEATEMYLSVNARKKPRSALNQKKHERFIQRAINALGKPDLLLTDFNRLKAQRHKEVLELANPTWKADTLNKTLSMLSAVFKFGIWQYELSMQNPWSGLKDEVADRKDNRRSFSPDELKAYVKALAGINEEARLIGLLMVFTGCRTMEAAGLTFADLQMQNNTPSMNLRPNDIRSLKNKQSKRVVPLIDKALDELRPYLAQRKQDPKAAVFPRYGRDGGMAAISALLNSVIRKKLGINDPTLVAYSSRHTIKDKLRAVRATAEYQHAILGHGSRTDADNYGQGEILRYLLEELQKAEAVVEWGSAN